MSLYMSCDDIPVEYIICLLNSDFLSNYVNDFVNNTSIFQINDARQLPIPIPNPQEIKIFSRIFDIAYSVKMQEAAKVIDRAESLQRLSDIQNELNKAVRNLYGV